MAFEKGRSGNPAGRRAEDRKVKLMARHYTDASIKKLASWMESDNPKASVSACVELLNRGWGKPKETVDITVEKIDRSPVERLRNHLRPANTESRTVN